MKTKLLPSIVTFLLFMGTMSAFPALSKDINGSADHPLVSRYQGSRIVGYISKDYDEYTAHLGPARGSYTNVKWENTDTLEGKVTRILYQAPKGRSTLEVFRNYQTELQKGGFEIVFSCKKDACGRAFYTMPGAVWGGSWIRNVYASDVKDQRYLVANLIRDEGTVNVFLHVSEHVWMNSIKGLYVHLDVVEEKGMDTGMVTVGAEAMAKDIGQTGHVAVYGIYFDTNKADIKPKSHAAITEIAKLLKQNADLNIFVVGHTDNVGEIQYNMDLSHRRATAIRDEIVNTHGIDINRLGAVGMGPFAPVTTNRTEEGRAQNRRVELVEF